jgi:hypothetical protein
MATMTIKSTYSLDPETVRLLEDLARRKGVSKSEVLRDAVRRAAAAEATVPAPALEAFDRLRGLIARDRDDVSRWAAGVEGERRASSLRREKRRR